MSWFRFLLFPLLISPLVLLTGALKRQIAPSAQPSPVAALTPPVEDKEATQILDQAVATLKPERLAWMEATLWQKIAWEDLTYQAEGRYLSGPGQRMHLDLHILLGRTRGEMQIISDGKTLWELYRVDGTEPLVSRVDVARVFQNLSGSTVRAKIQNEVFQNLCISGLAPLIQGLRETMTVTQQERLSWNMHDVIRLTLVWSAASAQDLIPPGKPWPAFLPRKCLLYLDEETLWPHRLEWWGPGKLPDRDTQVFQMEFRDPILNQPVSPQRCAKEFTYTPGPGEVPDFTQVVTESVDARAQQLARQQKPARP